MSAFLKASFLKVTSIFCGFLINYYIINVYGSKASGQFWMTLAQAGIISILILFGTQLSLIRKTNDRNYTLIEFLLNARTHLYFIFGFVLLYGFYEVTLGNVTRGLLSLSLVVRGIFTCWLRINRKPAVAFALETIIFQVLFFTLLILIAELYSAFIMSVLGSISVVATYQKSNILAFGREYCAWELSILNKFSLTANQLSKYLLDNMVILFLGYFVAAEELGSMLYSLKIMMLASIPLQIVRSYFSTNYSKLLNIHGFQDAKKYLVSQTYLSATTSILMLVSLLFLYSMLGETTIFSGFSLNSYLILYVTMNAIFGPIGVANNLSGLTYHMNILNILTAAIILIGAQLLYKYFNEHTFLIFASLMMLVWNFISWCLLFERKKLLK